MTQHTKRPLTATAAALCAALALSSCAPTPVQPPPPPSASASPTTSPTASEPEPGVTAPPPTSSPTPESTPTPPPTTELHPVERVVDGDTFYATIDGRSVGIRIIGIDTPETVHPSQPVECYGPEASQAAKTRLGGQHVQLIEDPTQGKLDEHGNRVDYYGRALFYVHLPDGTDYGLSMIEDGLAEEYTYRKQTYQRQAEYQDAEALAREIGAGQWGNC